MLISSQLVFAYGVNQFNLLITLVQFIYVAEVLNSVAFLPAIGAGEASILIKQSSYLIHSPRSICLRSVFSKRKLKLFVRLYMDQVGRKH